MPATLPLSPPRSVLEKMSLLESLFNCASRNRPHLSDHDIPQNCFAPYRATASQPDQNTRSDFGRTAARRSFCLCCLLRCLGREWHRPTRSNPASSSIQSTGRFAPGAVGHWTKECHRLSGSAGPRRGADPKALFAPSSGSKGRRGTRCVSPLRRASGASLDRWFDGNPTDSGRALR